jgi:hypothetical protein
MPEQSPNNLTEVAEQTMNIVDTVFDPILVFGILFIGYYATIDFFERAGSRIAEAVRPQVLKGRAPAYRERTHGPRQKQASSR